MKTLANERWRFIFLTLDIPMLLLIGFVVIPALDLFRMSATH